MVPLISTDDDDQSILLSIYIVSYRIASVDLIIFSEAGSRKRWQLVSRVSRIIFSQNDSPKVANMTQEDD